MRWSSRTQKRFWESSLGAIGLMLVVVALTGFVQARNLGRERAAARLEGIALAAADLPNPAVPPAQDASTIYRALDSRLRKNPIPDDIEALTYPLRNRSRWTPAELSAVRIFLTDRRNLVAMIHQAAKRPAVSFHRTFTDDEAITLDTTLEDRQRELAGVLRLESDLLAQDGRFQAAIRNQALEFRLAQHAASDPNIIGHLSGTAVEDLALTGFSDILLAAGPNAAVCAAVRETVTSHPVQHNLPRAYNGDLLYGLAFAGGLRLHGPAYWEWMQPRILTEKAYPFDRKDARWPVPFLGRIWMDGSEAFYLRGMRRVIAAARLTPPERGKALEKASSSLTGMTSVFARFANEATPVLAKAEHRETQAKTHRQIVLAAASLLEYKARRGSFPARLDEAVQPLPMDLFTGTPLQYRRTARGFVIFSSGEDGTFDPDVTRPTGAIRSLVFRFPGEEPTVGR